MKDYEPIMSFGEDVAAMYRDVKRGDEMAARSSSQVVVPCWNSPSAPVGSRCRSPLGGSRRRRRYLPCDEIAVTLGNFADVPRRVPLDLHRVEHAVQPADPGGHLTSGPSWCRTPCWGLFARWRGRLRWHPGYRQR